MTPLHQIMIPMLKFKVRSLIYNFLWILTKNTDHWKYLINVIYRGSFLSSYKIQIMHSTSHLLIAYFFFPQALASISPCLPSRRDESQWGGKCWSCNSSDVHRYARRPLHCHRRRRLQCCCFYHRWVDQMVTASESALTCELTIDDLNGLRGSKLLIPKYPSHTQAV